jgi:hypothetical protein
MATELMVMAFMWLRSKLVRLRRRITSSMRGWSQRPVVVGVWMAVLLGFWGGVEWDLEGVMLRTGRLEEEEL